MASKANLILQVKLNHGNRPDKDTVIGHGLDMCIQQIGEFHKFKELVTEADVDTVFTGGTGSCSTTTFTSTTAVFAETMEGAILRISGVSYVIDTYTSTTEVELTTSQPIAESTFTVSKQSISITTGYDKLLGVGQKGDLQAHSIPIRTKEWIDAHYPDPSQTPTGRPVWCYEDGANGEIVYVPSPDAAYTMELTVYTLPTVATDGATVTGFDSCLTAYATGYTFNSMEMFVSGGAWMNQYKGLLATAIQHYKRESGRVVRATPVPLHTGDEHRNTPDDFVTPDSLPT